MINMTLYKREMKGSLKILILFAAVITMYVTIIISMYDPEMMATLDGFYEVLGKTYVKLSSTESRTISASAGFAWTADSSMNITTLLNHADEALYEMKRNAKGSYEEYKG